MDVMKTCVLCEKDVGDDDVLVSKGLETLRRTSDIRKDGRRAIMDLHTELRVHRDCRVVYVQLKRSFASMQLSSQDEPSTSDCDHWYFLSIKHTVFFVVK